MKRLAVILFAVLVWQQISAQDPKSQPGGNWDINNAPAAMTPNVASLVKFIDYPVDKFNGQANISIPIYTIKDGDIEIPIVLRYHGGGIKVEEEASWVGLGWNLDVGGSITQTVRGKVDQFIGFRFEEPYQGCQWTTYDPDLNFWPVTMYDVYEYRTNESLVPPVTSNTYTCEDYWECDIANLANCGWNEKCVMTLSDPSWGYNTSDGQGGPIISLLKTGYQQPDIFYYNIPGESGKFFFNTKDGRIYFEKANNNKLTGDANASIYKLTTENGAEYHFDKVEKKYSANTPYETSITSYLTKMYTPKGNKVEFTYFTGNTIATSPMLKETEKKCPTSNCSPSCPNGNTPCSQGIDWGAKETILYEPTYIQTISTPNFIITFVLDDREDIRDKSDPNIYRGEKRLSKIIIESKSNVALKKTFVFENNDYFTSQSVGERIEDLGVGAINWQEASVHNMRLKLNGIHEEMTNPNDANNPYITNPYKFTYNATPIASKRSSAQDYWGYFNGQANTAGLIPSSNRLAWYDLRYTNTSFGSANRGSDDTYIKAGILEKITYPTGGYTQFEYEPHTFSNIMYEEAYYPRTDYNFQYPTPIATSGQPYRTSQSFYVSEGDEVYINLVARGNGCSNLTGSYISLTNYGNYSKQWTVGSQNLSLDNDGNLIFSEQISLAPGYYTLIANLVYSCSSNYYPEISGTATVRHITRPKNLLTHGAGLRVKTIKHVDNIDGTLKETRKKFIYDYTDAQGLKSYGKIMSPLKFYKDQGYKSYTLSTNPITGDITRFDYNYVVTTVFSNNIFPDPDRANGAFVGYSKVIEITDDGIENGTIESNYIAIPGTESEAPNIRNGLLTSEIYYDKDNNQVKKVENNYVELNAHNFFSATVEDAFPGNEPCVSYSDSATSVSHPISCPGYFPGRATITFVPMQSGSIKTDYTITTDLANGIESKTKTIYQYNALGQVKRVITLMPNVAYEPLKETLTTYVNDDASVNTSTSARSLEMVNSNFLAYPVKTEKRVGGGTVSFDQYSYDKQTNVSAENKIVFPLLQVQQAPKGTGIEYTYDVSTNKENGMVTQISSAKGNSAFIWGSNNNLLLYAKVANARADQVAYASFEDGLPSKWTGNGGFGTYGGTVGVSGKKYMTGGNITSPSLAPGDYLVSLWAKGSASYANALLTVNGSATINPDDVSGSFYQFKVTLGASAGISFDFPYIDIDEVRIYPVNAQMTTYTYEPLYGVSSITDDNNFTTRYIYDSFGRLLRIVDNDNKVLKEYQYNYLVK